MKKYIRSIWVHAVLNIMVWAADKLFDGCEMETNEAGDILTAVRFFRRDKESKLPNLSINQDTWTASTSNCDIYNFTMTVQREKELSE